MSTQQTALENLRVIRSLMEKAHIYRAISVKAALSGGGFALFLAGRGMLAGTDGRSEMSREEFLASWLVLLAVVSAVNIWHLSREAKLRGQTLVSAGMRMALRAFFPPMLVGGVIGIGLINWHFPVSSAALTWILCYGLAVLATASFSPRSLIRMGWAFVILGLILATCDLWTSPRPTGNGDIQVASFYMQLSFGFIHLFYGLAVFVSKKPEPLPAE